MTKVKRTAAENAATSTASQRSSKSMKEQFLELRESLQNGTHNPFQRVDGQVLERIHRATKKHLELEDVEDAPL